MAFEALAIFGIAFLASAITPGPDTMTLLGRSIGGGFLRALPFAVGIALAKVVLLSAALFGLAELAANARTIFVLVKWLGASWLIFVGLKKLLQLRRIDAAPSSIEEGENSLGEREQADGPAGRVPVSDVVVGFALGLSNPVAITFYVAILPTVIDLSAAPISQWVPLAATLLAMFGIVTLVWAGLGHSFRHLLTSPRSRRYLSAGEGTVLVATGAAIAIRR